MGAHVFCCAPESGHCAMQSACPKSAQQRTHASHQTALLFDHLVGELLQLRGHVKAESLRGFDVDDQAKLGRLFDR
jgi:hypothetical protein